MLPCPVYSASMYESIPAFGGPPYSPIHNAAPNDFASSSYDAIVSTSTSCPRGSKPMPDSADESYECGEKTTFSKGNESMCVPSPRLCALLGSANAIHFGATP